MTKVYIESKNLIKKITYIIAELSGTIDEKTVLYKRPSLVPETI